MKKVNVFFVGMLFLLLSFSAKAQTNTSVDYFVGKWDVLVSGTPSGDAKMILKLERKDGKLTGTVTPQAADKGESKITSIEEQANTITVYFTAGEYDVNFSLDKKDDDHVTGSMMGMFDAKGERIKETK
jgi:hypothetical protein